jgi:tetratricopeptide (TPR) repeat protein
MAAAKRRASLWGGWVGWVGAAVVAVAAVAAVLALRGGDAPAPTGPDPPPGRPDAGRAPRGDGPAAATPDRDAAPPPETAPGLVEAARAEAAAGHYVQALALYQRAHDLDPAPSTLLEVGRMLHLSGRCREARRTTQRVLAASPPSNLAAAAQEQLDKIGRCD